MEFAKNPFYILSATPRDGRHRLMELAEERSLLFNADECREAYSVLTNPRRRLSAEISWFPGVGPKKIEELLAVIKTSPDQILAEQTIPSLARANMLAECISRLSSFDAPTISSWIIAIDESFDATEAEDVCRLLNAERVAAGFPEISEVSLIEEELENCRNTYRTAIRRALDKLPSRELIRAVTLAVEEAGCYGLFTINEVLTDTVDLYELEAQEFLAKEEENINSLIERIKEALKNNADDARIQTLVDHLAQVVKNWAMVARPIQLSTKSRGLDHEASKRIGGNIRGLAIYLFNKYEKLSFAQELTALMQDVFAEVDKVAELASDDAEQLKKISEQKTFDIFLNPIHKLCAEVVEYSDKNPDSTEVKIRQLIQSAHQLISNLEGAVSIDNNDIVNNAKDEIALAILLSSISYGNKTKKWNICLDFIKDAKKFATNKMTISRIDHNMSIAMDNINSHSDLIPINSAPSLYTINATGFTLYGCTDYNNYDNSYVATYYFVLLAIPLLPIARYRVIDVGNNGYRFLGKLPLRLFDKIHFIISIIIIFIIIASFN